MAKSGPKLLDANAKLIAEFDFEGLLLLMDAEPGARIVKIEEIEREMTLPQMRIDQGAKLTLERVGGKAVYIIEFLARWKSNAPLRMRNYCRAAEIKHACPVNGIIAVCTPARAPKRIPVVHSYGELDRHPFHFGVFCAWKVRGERILAMNRRDLLPLVALAEPNPENIRKARSRLRGERNRNTLAQLRSLASVYYTEEQILDLFGEDQGMMYEVALQESAWFRGILKRAKADARVARKEAIDETLRAFLGKRFPDLATMPELKRLGCESARELLLELVDIQDAATARGVISRRGAKR